jgi:predicted membrane chloride channel (bestrophin family)
MGQYISILNYRTLLALIVSVVTIFLAYKYHINFSVDLTLISIAIIFPLVFSIRGSFRRREKALEHLSRFRSSLKTISSFILSKNEMSEELKKEFSEIIVEISETVVSHLQNKDSNTKDLDSVTDRVYDFIADKDEFISRSLRDKVFRYMNDLHESVENLRAIHIHRTPISLRAYCIVFIYLFPLIYTPTIISDIGLEKPQWITYFIVLVSEFILISLYNIQDHMEYPFDDVGLDDIKLENFKIDR